ncbi:MAG: fumarylacetoacetate hydrolase family protein [Pseudomonadota bacterium]
MTSATDAFPAPPVPRLAIADTGQTFPINRIFCIGRNYAAHAAEMGQEVERERPFFFTKGHHAVVLSGGEAPYPPGTTDYHHEIELVVAIGGTAAEIPESRAMDLVLGYGMGLDMTRRDLQQANRKKGLPWDVGKDVSGSCILSPLTTAAQFTPGDQRIHLSVNGSLRQDASLSELIWSLPELIAFLSTLYTLEPGDIILTGTPAGVGPVVPGDMLEGGIDGLQPLSVRIGGR